jgi:hypothetical protein
MLEVEGLRLKRKEQLENKLYVTTVIAANGVIPAPYQVRDKLQRESRKELDSPVSSTGQAQSSPE